MSIPITLLLATAVLVIALVTVAAAWAHRRLGAPWRLFWWGALGFVASQVLRVPLLGAAGIMFPDAAVLAGIAVVTSGLFEETARFVVLRFWARARQWRDGVMVGLGHGGIEAVLLLGLSTAGAILLLVSGDAVLQAAEQAGAQTAAVVDQIAAARSVTPVSQAVALWERVCAVVVHVALTLIVLRGAGSSGGDALRWWLLAVLAHAAFNAAALAALRAGGMLAAEVVVTVAAALALWYVLRSREAALQPAGDAGER